MSARRVLPGFRLTLGYTLLWLGLLVLLPLAVLAFKALGAGWGRFFHAASDPRAIASYRLSFGAAFVAAAIDAAFGVVIAWVLVRYRFFGKPVVDALVDLPFALPTAVAGIALTAVYAGNGAIGKTLARMGVKIAFTPLGVVLAMTFVGLPFVVRTVEPVLREVARDSEEAAATLGASRLQTIRRVILPAIVPAALTGFALSLARGLGEYGSIVFISGNMPMKTEITPLLVVTKLEQYDYVGAMSLAVVMLIASFVLLLMVNLLQAWTRRRVAVR